MINIKQHLNITERSGLFKVMLFFVSLCFFAIILGLINTKHAYAVTLNPDPGAAITPNARNYLENVGCPTNPTAGVELVGWDSVANDPGNTNYTVNYGDPFVIVQDNQAAAVCLSNNAITRSNDFTTASSPGVAFAIGSNRLIDIHSKAIGHYDSAAPTQYIYQPPGGFTASGFYTFGIYGDQINEFNDGASFGCVTGNLRAPTSLNDYSACVQGWTWVTIFVTVRSTQVQGHVYKVDASGNPQGDVIGAKIYTCNTNVNDDGPDTTHTWPATGLTQSGFFYFVVSPNNPGFCVRVVDPPPAGYSGPYIRPWSEGYYSNVTTGPPSGNNSGPSCPSQNPNPPPGFTVIAGLYPGRCDNPSYEWQTAGVGQGYQPRSWTSGGVNFAGTFYDRTADTGYDIVYVQNPPTATCQAKFTSTNPNLQNPEAGDNVTVTFTVTATTGTIDNGNYRLTSQVKLPNGTNQPGTNVAYQPSPLTAGQSTDGSLPNTITINNVSLGQYTVTGTLTGPPGFATQTCPVTIPVANKPYFTVRNGDLGVGTATACTGWGPAFTAADPSVLAWNQGTGPFYQGSGTNLAAFALNVIDGFATAQPNSGSPPPSSLAFANANTLTSGYLAAGGNPTGFGGGLTGGIPCPENYFSHLNKAAANSILLPTLNVASINTNKPYYKDNGNLTLNVNGANNIPAGSPGNPAVRPTIFVDGHDVLIMNNLTLGTAPAGDDLSEMPNFYLVVKGGNIYIAPGVSQLDGVYIAQPDDATGNVGGNIFTCSNGFTSPTSAQMNSAAQCMQPLLIDGAFVAKEVKLYRSSGTLKQAGTAAEKFRTSTNTWLATPCVIADCDSSGATTGPWQYDSITSLPPIL